MDDFVRWLKTLDVDIENIILNKQYKLFDKIFNHKYFVNSNKDKIYLIFSKYLALLPDNILCGVLNIFSENIDNITAISYYVSHKLKGTKYIPFELFPINKNKLLYSSILLLNDEYLKENDPKITKFKYIFNKLPYDMKLKLCGINNINDNDVKLCSIYLS
mgnify:CR=1 FL=1